MSAKRKITIVFSIVIFVMLAALIGNVSVNFRNYGLKSAEEKAKLTAEIVKDGLTAHMVNNMMDHRDFFLRKIEGSKNVKELWVTRSESVISQFGQGMNNELPRDDIDKKVLRTGVPEKIVKEDSDTAELRVTIPYVATGYGTPNCLSCHDAKEGEVLGTVSMTMDVQNLRTSGLNTIFNITAITVITLIISLIIMNKMIAPFMRLLESVSDVLMSAKNGDYSHRVIEIDYKEGKELAKWINLLLEKLQDTLNEIENKIEIFLHKNTKRTTTDPLIEAKEIIGELSDIYKFKKTVVFDKDKRQAYERLANVLKEKFKLTDFNITESDRDEGTVKYVHIENKKRCENEKHECRANRTKSIVDSGDFASLCENFSCHDTKHYICLPYEIGENINIVISIYPEDEQGMAYVRSIEPSILNYVEAIKPEIVSKNLNEILKRSARTDQLTGLYNRKFLDEFIEKAIPQAQRSGATYGVLMLDIDFFKMINDTYGHDVGDIAIRKLADVIKASIRNSDLAIRFGGEEFIILLYNCSRESLFEIAEKIRIAFSKEKIDAPSGAFTKTISIGCSFFPDDSKTIWRCIKFADIALYKAKNSGRNRCIMFESEMFSEESEGINY